QSAKKQPLTLTYTSDPQPKSEEVKAQAHADTIIRLGKESTWTILDVKETPAQKNPYPPFTTSTLQQAASSRLGLSPSMTMRFAQKLYEAGHISYMRTDSVTLNEDVIKKISTLIDKEYGPDYVEERRYKTKSKNAQEAHEAIRPTHPEVKMAGTGDGERKLYTLIRNRTLASQMAAAKILRTKIIAQASHVDVPQFATTGSVVLFPGWYACDSAARGEDSELPKITVGEALTLQSLTTEEKWTTPPNRYSEAGLVKELEKRGIGRPSTYASIIKTIIDRGYVLKDGKALQPTETGEVVDDFLALHFAEIVSDVFTADMESKLDDIANGDREYEKTLRAFYTPFAKEVKSKDKIDKVTNMGDAPAGTLCPKCGASMVIKLAKNGKFLSCSKFPECTGARTIDGLELEGPKETGEACPDCKDGKLVERDGRYGRFIACSNYPKCKHIKNDPSLNPTTGVKCPLCKDGEMSERRGRFGIFYSCTNYPKCKNAIKAKPTGNICSYVRDDKDGKKCGALMMEGTKTIPERCSDKTCPNHNPHKLGK
ncbi:MAG: topoisomerase DNA-binding C4 zinc finger domain-containing protein, partial [Candidatus Moranbacteria bacterium]|nr:topoisomerase DNA-binding C4 zinc finger domain-containing protein [Candidatus Moranbacteria bacterium]